jgi:propanol-preferring alcohol dehydrogenase
LPRNENANMKAAILDNGKLQIQDIPKPEPKFEEALVKITTAGVCHSDLHLVKGDWPSYATPGPSKLGHEAIGIVEQLGSGADKFVKVGDRVILGLGGSGGGYWCGACEFCLSNRPRLCKEAKGIRGTYAEHISLWAKSLVKLPNTVADSEVSLACGGLTAYSALKKLLKFGVYPGKPIAIIGAAGGLGHYAVQIAKAFGYIVVGVDVGKQRVEFVKALGADDAVTIEDAASLVKTKYSGVYGVIVFSPKIAGFDLGLKLLKRGGVFVGVGMPAASDGDISIAPLELLRKDPLIMSSAVGTVEEMRELVQLSAEGKVKTHVSRVGCLSEVNQILDELEAGKYSGRALINNMLI